VRIAWNDLTVSSISGSRFVAWHPEVCPTAQAFVRWQREYPWEDLKNPFYQRYSRRVHLVTRSGPGYDDGNKLFAWELLSYFHSCSSIATFLARLELERLAGHEREYDIDREGSTLWTLSLVENSGWLLHWGRSWTPTALYKLTGVDPAVSDALGSIGVPICRNYRRLGSVSLRRSREIWEALRASRSPSAASSSA